MSARMTVHEDDEEDSKHNSQIACLLGEMCD